MKLVANASAASGNRGVLQHSQRIPCGHWARDTYLQTTLVPGIAEEAGVRGAERHGGLDLGGGGRLLDRSGHGDTSEGGDEEESELHCWSLMLRWIIFLAIEIVLEQV